MSYPQPVIFYIRFSTREQTEGTSTTRQRNDCFAHILKREWPQPEAILLDEGKSAFSGKHRELGSALGQFEEEAREGLHHGKILLVERLDRLSRQGHEDTFEFIRSLGRCGVSVATVDGDAFYEAGAKIGLVEIITMLVKAETAHEESVKKSERLKARYVIRRAESEISKKALGRNCPAWLIVDKSGGYVMDAAKVALVREIFALADSGHGAITIAKILNRRGEPVWQRYVSRPVRHWDRTFIRKLLLNRAVVGEFQPHEMIDGKRVQKGEPFALYPRIIDEELFQRVRDSAPSRAATKGGGKSSVVANLVSGLVKCAVCGGGMNYIRQRAAGSLYRTRQAGNLATLKHESATLQCRTAYHGGPCVNRSQITYYGFERALLDACLHIALDDRAFSRRDEVGALSAKVAECQRAAEIVQSKAERLWTVYAESEGTAETPKKLAEKAEAEVKALKSELAILVTARDRASGQASSEEHLSRIAEIRRHLYDDDLEVRALHRKKVMAGFNSVITEIRCDADKVATITFAGGLAALQIQRGKVIRQANALRMFGDGDYSSLGNETVQRAAKTVGARMRKTLVENGSLRAA